MATKAEMEARIKEFGGPGGGQNGAGTVSFKVSQKGALSVYGLGRWPTTLYRSQWERLLEHEAELRAFMEANAAKLTVKAGS